MSAVHASTRPAQGASAFREVAGAAAAVSVEHLASAGAINLSALLPRVQAHPSFAQVVRAIEQAETLSIADPAKAYVLAALHSALNRPVAIVTARPDQARQLWEELSAWSPEPTQVLHFPAPDALPYERLPDDPANTAERVGVLNALATPGARPLVVLSLRAALDTLQTPESFRASSRLLRTGDAISPSNLVEVWLAGGYEPSPLVDEPGQFSRRGGILDVFPPGAPPCRIEFLGDTIESLRVFNPETQRSGETVDRLWTPPAHDRAPSTTTVLDHLPSEGLIVLDEPARLRAVSHDLEQQIRDLRQQLEVEEVAPDRPPYVPWSELEVTLCAGERQLLALAHDPDRETIPFNHAPAFGGRLRAFIDGIERTLREQDHSVAIVSQQSARLQELFADRGIFVTPTDRLSSAETTASLDSSRSSTVALIHGSLPEGWLSKELGAAVYTDSELFGWRKIRRPVRRSRGAAREAFLSDLEPGELVVHIDHGIAHFRGLVTVGRANGSSGEAPEREFLLLEYADGDKLYVPSEQADRVTRYVGGGEERPHPTRLRSQEWTRAKARVRRAVRDIARDLLELYAARETAHGHPFAADTGWQRELEDSFPYVETPDQSQAVQEVKEDMERARPMDRLLVGDVGYGKTEVALRAAFKAVMDGRQVAVLVPTTVLAQQHFGTFEERLAAFPVRVEMLSRFRSEREQRDIVEGLKDGSIDICIGTHRLVQKDVRFKNLGLVIIDEEQRFGVAHKERLKQLRKELDVLTLTATPIPRTLQMSLTGVRDMSAIATAPEDRLPIRTYVAEYDEGMIREVILREIDRGGQVYFVHNRVQTIDVVASRLRRLVPEARFSVGHGQMPEDQLESVMVEFANGNADVLICTTIIESGLDIPNVNTIVVDNADRFGLAQLYQLRGRVGRGAVRAYAYFLYARDTSLTEQAEQRLRTIFEATELGAGFRIAMKDLEIRGAGNLLGAEQSGHIAAVGFDLYNRLLAEAIDVMRAARDGGQPADITPQLTRPSLDVPIDAHLPADYVADEAARLNLYQRLATCSGEDDLAALVSEIQDRFGALPTAAENLIFLVGLRLQAQKAGVRQVSTTDAEVVVKFNELPRVDVRRLSQEVGSPLRAGSNQLRLPRGRGQAWLADLQRLIDLLPAA